MLKSGNRIIKANNTFYGNSSGYDNTHSYMQGYNLDLTRKTAALLRQSHKAGSQNNPESRLRQEGLVRIAIEIRADRDQLMVVDCDEGSGVSGKGKFMSVRSCFNSGNSFRMAL